MNGEFLNNLYMLGGLFVATTTVVWLLTSANRRAAQRESDDLRRDLRRDISRVEKGISRVSKDVRRVSKDVRRVDKRLSVEAQKTREEVWWLRVDMEVVKDRLNIRTVSRPVDSAPVASDPEAASLASPAPVVVDPAPESADADSVVPAPVASETEPAPSAISQAVGNPGASGAVASESGSVGSAPVEDIPEADVGSEAVADRPGPAGVVSPGFSATPLAAEK